MICPDCGAGMVGITYPDGYMEFECENYYVKSNPMLRCA